MRCRYAFIHTYKPVLDDAPFRSFDTMAEYRAWCEANLPSWLGYGRAVASATRNCCCFDYAQAQEIRDAFARHGVRYLFLGKSGAILLGFPDTTQDAHLFVDKAPANGAAVVRGLIELGFTVTDELAAEVRRGKDFVQIKSGPFDLDLVSLPTASRPSPRRGRDAWRSRASPCATRTTSSPARRPRTA